MQLKKFEDFKEIKEQLKEGVIKDTLRKIVRKGVSAFDNLLRGDSLEPDKMKKNKETMKKNLKIMKKGESIILRLNGGNGEMNIMFTMLNDLTNIGNIYSVEVSKNETKAFRSFIKNKFKISADDNSVVLATLPDLQLSESVNEIDVNFFVMNTTQPMTYVGISEAKI